MSLVDVVAQRVAAAPPTVQAGAPVEAGLVAAPVGRALLVLVDQRVDEEMDGPLVGTFDRLLKSCDETGELEKPEILVFGTISWGRSDFWAQRHRPQSLTVAPLAPPKSVPSCLLLLLSGGFASDGRSARRGARVAN